MSEPAPRYVVSYRDISLADLPRVGGKNASLGEMVCSLEPHGVAVPNGFAVTADAFRTTLSQAGLEEEIYGALDRLDTGNLRELAQVGERIRERVRAAPLPGVVVEQVNAAYDALSQQYGQHATDVAVR